MKGLFIPEITEGMFRNSCLESIEAFIAEGEIYDIDYSPRTPVSEGLPKTDNWRTTFNVTTKTGGVMSMEWENTIVRGKPVSRWVWQDRIAPWDVVAWMPLPEPYEVEERGQNE